MIRDTLLDEITGNNIRPNKFTIGMGKLIRAAREEVGYSQRELAELIYRRQAALSDMENGKMEPDASTILLLSHTLHKPLTFFYPEPWKPKFNIEDLSEIESDLLIQARRLDEEDKKRLLAQAKTLADFADNS